MYILLLLCTLVHICSMHAADSQNQLAIQTLFNNAQSDYQKSLETPALFPKLGLLYSAKKTFKECSLLLAKPEELNEYRGLVALGLAQHEKKQKEKNRYALKAQTLFQESGTPFACFNLGRILHTGPCNIPPDPAKAFDWYTQALPTVPLAYTNLLFLKAQFPDLLKAKTIPELPEEIKKSAQPSPIAQYNSAQTALESDNNTDDAMKLFERVMFTESPVRPLALLEQGRCLLTQKEFPAAAELFMSAFKERASVQDYYNPDEFAQKMCNCMCQLPDAWYKHEAHTAEPLAQEKIHHTVEQLLFLPAQANFPKAQYELGLFYRARSINAQKNDANEKNNNPYPAKELEWLKRSADQEYLVGMHEYACSLQSQKQYKSAIEWYIKATENGCLISSGNLLILRSKEKKEQSVTIKEVDQVITQLNEEIEKRPPDKHREMRNQLLLFRGNHYCECALRELVRVQDTIQDPSQNDYTEVTRLNTLAYQSFNEYSKKSGHAVVAQNYFDCAMVEKEMGKHLQMCTYLFETKKADPNYHQADVELGDYYLSINKFELAKNAFELAMNLGNQIAPSILGNMMRNGYGYVPDNEKEYKLIKKTVDVLESEALLDAESSKILQDKTDEISNRLAIIRPSLTCATIFQPYYLSTVSEKQFQDDVLILHAMQDKSDVVGIIALGKLYQNILNLPKAQKAKFYHYLTGKNNQETIINAAFFKCTRYWYTQAAKMNNNLKALYHLCALEIPHDQLSKSSKENIKKNLATLTYAVEKYADYYYLAASYLLLGHCQEHWDNNLEAAWTSYKKAADFGDKAPLVVVPDACVKMARKNLEEKNVDCAILYFKKAAPHRPDVCLLLGNLFFEKYNLHTIP